MVRPAVNAPSEKGDIDMPRVPRVPERTATPEELAEETRRSQEAREQNRPLAPLPTDEGNLCSVLALFAAWRPCNCCGRRVLFVDERMQTNTTFLCGRCEMRRATLGMMFRQIQPCRVCRQLSAKLVEGLCWKHVAPSPPPAPRRSSPSLTIDLAMIAKGMASQAVQR